MNIWTPNPALYLSPEMVHELALGIDPPLKVAQKYGLSAAEFQQLQAQEWFGKAVFDKRAELHKGGMTFAVKARMIAEEVMQDIFQKSKTTDVRVEHMLEFLKQTADYGGLKGKTVETGPAVPQFQINITIPDNAQGPSSVAIQASETKPEAMVIELTPEPAIPPPPPHLRVPDFKLTTDLAGKP